LVAARITAYIAHQRKKHQGGKHHITWGSFEILDISIDMLRTCILLTLILMYFALIVIPSSPSPTAQRGDAEETTGLLAHGSGAGSDGEQPEYGSIPSVPEASAKAPAGWARRTTVGKQSWWEYLRGYAIFFPYLWPSNDRRLQIVMILCFVLVTLQRGINVAVPHQLGRVTDILSGEDGPRKCTSQSSRYGK
jgi:hypothetical protein